ncbi:unnamed protein product, partial [Nesidiocoris tenuis]
MITIAMMKGDVVQQPGTPEAKSSPKRAFKTRAASVTESVRGESEDIKRRLQRVTQLRLWVSTAHRVTQSHRIVSIRETGSSSKWLVQWAAEWFGLVGRSGIGHRRVLLGPWRETASCATKAALPRVHIRPPERRRNLKNFRFRREDLPRLKRCLELYLGLIHTPSSALCEGVKWRTRLGHLPRELQGEGDVSGVYSGFGTRLCVHPDQIEFVCRFRLKEQRIIPNTRPYLRRSAPYRLESSSVSSLLPNSLHRWSSCWVSLEYHHKIVIMTIITGVESATKYRPIPGRRAGPMRRKRMDNVNGSIVIVLKLTIGMDLQKNLQNHFLNNNLCYTDAESAFLYLIQSPLHGKLH